MGGAGFGEDGTGSARLRWIGIACLLVTTVGWGLNWPAIKFLLREWPPLFSRGVSGLAAAAILAVIASRAGERLAVAPQLLPKLSFLAFTNVFVWMGLGTVMMQWVTVAEGALLIYSMPIWSVLLAWPLLGTRPTIRTAVALGLGIAGTSVLLGAQGFDFGSDKAWGVAVGISAAILFALGGILNRTPLPIPPLTLVAWQLGLGCLPMLLIGLVLEHDRIGPLSMQGWLLMAYMTLVPMALCYTTWFASLRYLPPTHAATGTLLVPVVGTIGAALALGEPLGLREALALALTLSGVTLALRQA
ncbi:DMT family transporter [Enterovirga rhinocerotis]|uniref:Drug/metabolite transporter (DMT)-like permease n=1 Tax=Enterovirga rhinocerotis TaxID=1339210 RepID=A0A4R7C5E7_9HYPH|nr:DMT family transporter [Enterovirga rhinocerotis]TDR93598.1 drug/metabolite transporter (DMT)-like permease [Enterovirga rhinocerotis]